MGNKPIRRPATTQYTRYRRRLLHDRGRDKSHDTKHAMSVRRPPCELDTTAISQVYARAASMSLNAWPTPLADPKHVSALSFDSCDFRPLVSCVSYSSYPNTMWRVLSTSRALCESLLS